MERQTETCPNCGKNKTDSRSGSITQWLSICRCGQLENREGPSESGISFCDLCKKRINKGRQGSLTQWVFHSEFCKCETPVPRNPTKDEIFGEIAKPQGELDEKEIDDESELEVAAESFPVDRYKPLFIIGEGSSGAVFLCRDRLLRKKVAVKVLKHVGADSLVTFQNEAKMTDKLHHPDIVQILDFGATPDGFPYMVMEYLKGKTIKQLVKDRGVLDPFDAAIVFTKVTGALAYAHEHGVLHRDLQANNIIVDFQEHGIEVHILDFGLAKVMWETQEPTIINGNTIVGTPFYMSPDQVRGLPYDSRSEVYSVGCILFESLTGSPPFVGDTPLETLGMHARNVAPSVSDYIDESGLSTQLASIVSTCLEKDPEKRFQSMQEMLDRFERIFESEGAENSAVQAPRRVKAHGTVRRPTVVVSLVLCVVLVVVAAFSVRIMSVMQFSLHPSHGTGNIVDADLAAVKRAYGTGTTRLKLLRRMLTKPVKKEEKYTTTLLTYNPHFGRYYTPDDIRRVDLTGCDATDDDLTTLSKLRKIEELCFTKNSLITAKGLSQLARIKSLKELTFADMPFRTSDFTYVFSNLHNLEIIELIDNPSVNDSVVEVIAKNNPGLRYLALDGSKVTALSAEYLRDLSKLESLSLLKVKLDQMALSAFLTLPMPEIKVSDDCLKESDLVGLKTSSEMRVFDINWTGNHSLSDATIQKIKANMPGVQVNYFHF